MSSSCSRVCVLCVFCDIGICSAIRPKRRPPGGVTQGFLLVPVFSSDVFAGGGVEQNDENGLGVEDCDSSDVPRNKRRLSDF